MGASGFLRREIVAITWYARPYLIMNVRASLPTRGFLSEPYVDFAPFAITVCDGGRVVCREDFPEAIFFSCFSLFVSGPSDAQLVSVI